MKVDIREGTYPNNNTRFMSSKCEMSKQWKKNCLSVSQVRLTHSSGWYLSLQRSLGSQHSELWSLLSLWPGWGGRGRVWGGGWWQYCQHYRPHVAISPEFRGRASDQWPVGGGWRVSVVLWPASHPHHHLHPRHSASASSTHWEQFYTFSNIIFYFL